MSLPADLLALAHRLVTMDPTRPRQATLRRAVSTAYYALFHLLAEEVASLFVQDSETVAGRIARTVDHKPMKEISGKFIGGTLPESIGPFPSGFIPDELKRVARAFASSQDKRHAADYDRSFRISRTDAAELVSSIEAAFTDWKVIRRTDAARLYLGCFLLWKTWNDKPPR